MSLLTCLHAAFTLTPGHGASFCSAPGMLLGPPTAGPLQIPQGGAQARRHLLRPEAMVRKWDYPAAVFPLSPSPIPPSAPNHCPALAQPPPPSAHGHRVASCTLGTHGALLSAGQRKVYSALCVGAASFEKGRPHQQAPGRHWEALGGSRAR